MFNLCKKAARIAIDVHSASDFARIAAGFFICVNGRGGESLGHKSACGLYWTVRRPSTMTDKELDTLPIVRLHPLIGHIGATRFSNHELLDTQQLERFSGEFEWDGAIREE